MRSGEGGSVLFDAPGPRARRRHRVINGVAAALLAAVGYLVYRRLDQAGQLHYELWEPFVTPKYAQALLVALLANLQVAAVAIALAVGFGAVFAVARLSNHAWLRWPAGAVVEFFRAAPVLIMIFFISAMYGIEIGKFWTLVAALVLYNGAVLAEVFRSGVQALPRGQGEAAFALGLRKSQVMTLVLLPQAARIMLPSIISQAVITLKDSALGYIIPYEELNKVSRRLVPEFHNALPTAVVVAAAFIVINYVLSTAARMVEQRLRRSRKRMPDASDPTTAANGHDPAEVIARDLMRKATR